jgi:DNA-binding transcriptional ArsR family regulator
MAIDKPTITARLQDINEGLVRQSGGLVEAHYRKSKRFGAAARVCNLIKGCDVVSDYNSLVASAGELGIGADTLDAALRELEEIGYVSLHRSGGDIQKIEERIPLLDDRFVSLADKWLDSNPSEIEKATVRLLDDLMLTPDRIRSICKKRSLDAKSFDIIRDVGRTGEFLKTYTSPVDGTEIAYSPLYHDENPEKTIHLIDAFPDEDIAAILRSIRDYQGKPVDSVTDIVLRAAIETGCLPTPTVNSTNGSKKFVFTPLQGVGKLEKALLEKARAIVACVRYGEHFAGVTRIIYPKRILERLKENKVIGPHSEIKEQYVLLQKLGVGVISRSPHYHSRFVFRLLDTEENLRALDMAIQYLTVHEIVKGDPREEDARQLLLPGIYESPLKTRMEIRPVKETKLSPTSVSRLHHLIIGGSSGID